MKKINLLLVVTLMIALLTGCQNNGKKYEYNSKQNIYYKGDGVTEADAKKLSAYLNEIGYFGGDKELSVQITKEKATKDTMNVKFVVDESKITDKVETAFKLIGGFISKKVFNGNPVNLSFIDDHFKEVKNFGYVSPAEEVEATQGQ